MNQVVDARNIPCPGPVIEAKKALKDMKEGTLQILVSDAIAVQNLTKLASFLKLPVTSRKLEDGSFQVDMKVNGEMTSRESVSQDNQQETEDVACTPDSRRKGQVVVLSADHMGEGDEVLGKVLMKGFIYALLNQEYLPETILLYNGGARLSVEGSESLEDLKILESQGVEILTCGTCLNHYGLTEKLAVGSVTNMYDIAEKMTSAGTLVRP